MLLYSGKSRFSFAHHRNRLKRDDKTQDQAPQYNHIFNMQNQKTNLDIINFLDKHVTMFNPTEKNNVKTIRKEF